MKFVDTHSHIYLSQFDEDNEEVVERAIKAGVDKIILPNIDPESLGPNINLAMKYPNNCFPVFGLHPTNVNDGFEKELEQIFISLEKEKHVGVGEIGIDLYWDKTYFEQQKTAFRMQMEYALERDLPVVVHSRDSFNEIMEALDNINAEKYKGIFHAFGGDEEQALQIIEKGFVLGIGGVVTFKNSKLPDAIKNIDLKHVVLETDSPYLAPTPQRGKRNESSYIPLIAKKIAEIKGVPLDEVAEQTTHNAEILFSI